MHRIVGSDVGLERKENNNNNNNNNGKKLPDGDLLFSPSMH
jgi:hypothetical protein